MLTDIHTHLYHFNQNEIKDIIDRANKKGIGRIITCVYNKDTLIKTLPLLKSYKNIYLSMGVHPQTAWVEKKEYKEFISIMEKTLEGAVAIGEIGYDNYPGNPSIVSQREVFLRQSEFTKFNRLPVIIHCRRAFEQMFMDLEDMVKNNVKIILHSYSGGYKHLDLAVKKNCYISFSGSLTFKKSRNLKRIAEMVPINQILCETDSPFIPPETIPPTDITRPEHLSLVFKALVEARQEREDTIKKSLEDNINSLFDFERIDKDREKWIRLIEDTLQELNY